MGIIGTFLAGGQTWAHRIRMLRHVIKLTTLTSFFCGFLVFLFLLSTQPFVLYQSLWYYTKANIIKAGSSQIEVSSEYWESVSNVKYHIDNLVIPSHEVTTYSEPYVKLFSNRFLMFIRKVGSVFIWSFIALLIFFLIRGYIASRKRHISGRKIVWWPIVKLKLILTKKNSSIHLGKLPLVRGTETQHILITGGTGSGKTNCFHHIFPQIRDQHKAVIVDTTGSFIKRYYDPSKDIILNPLDPASMSWHPWIECKDRIDYDNLAECFIPHSYSEHDDYWRSASRALFVSLLIKAECSKKTSNITRWILYETLAKLCTYVQGTKGAAHIDPSSDKTAASIRSVASTYLTCLEFLKDTSTPFSIRDWIQNDNQKGWLFLTCPTSQRASLRPLISTWFSIASKSLINHTIDLERRVWFIVDELQSLNKLKDLETFLTEARKYGGCALLALQSLAQLETIYGREVTKTIIGNCATKVAFSEQDPEIAFRISKAFGEREIQEYLEGISYGAHEARDGVNLSLQKKSQPLVSVTAIQSLKRNHAFVKLPESFPITKIKLKIIR